MQSEKEELSPGQLMKTASGAFGKTKAYKRPRESPKVEDDEGSAKVQEDDKGKEASKVEDDKGKEAGKESPHKRARTAKE